MVFTQHATTAQISIEVIVPEAQHRLLYRLINAPFKALQECRHVKAKPQVAELLLRQEAVA
jgi:hypothetical protein